MFISLRSIKYHVTFIMDSASSPLKQLCELLSACVPVDQYLLNSLLQWQWPQGCPFLWLSEVHKDPSGKGLSRGKMDRHWRVNYIKYCFDYYDIWCMCVIEWNDSPSSVRRSLPSSSSQCGSTPESYSTRSGWNVSSNQGRCSWTVQEIT